MPGVSPRRRANPAKNPPHRRTHRPVAADRLAAVAKVPGPGEDFRSRQDGLRT